jgi:hypothetical protein
MRYAHNRHRSAVILDPGIQLVIARFDSGELSRHFEAAVQRLRNAEAHLRGLDAPLKRKRIRADYIPPLMSYQRWGLLSL